MKGFRPYKIYQYVSTIVEAIDNQSYLKWIFVFYKLLKYVTISFTTVR